MDRILLYGKMGSPINLYVLQLQKTNPRKKKNESHVRDVHRQ